MNLSEPLEPILLLWIMILCQGCSSTVNSLLVAKSPSPEPPASPTSFSLEPSQSTIELGAENQFSITGGTSSNSCTWQSSDPATLESLGDGKFQGEKVGNATVSTTCGSQTAKATVYVFDPGPVQITSGGTYSGAWTSNDPNTPTVTIATDEPVTLRNSVISGRGDLISISGVSSGANVSIVNVTGLALDPQIRGMQRGRFVNANNVDSLSVQNNTINGASFGVVLGASQVSSLKIMNNLASNLEDRASDGAGGLLPVRPGLGHFVIINSVTAPSGAEIGWNQVVQVVGQSSTEDVINIYKSQGSPANPIWVHDNYMEGYSSTTTTTGYTGSGVISDGSSSAPVTGYVLFQNNEMVHTAGAGVAIANGHDITAIGNRVVSCGQDSSGNWFAMPSANAVVVWDSYETGPQLFFNNTVTGTAGGLVRPDAKGGPMVADIWVDPPNLEYPSIDVSPNEFTNPCISGQIVNLQAEDAERLFWAEKVATANEMIGDQH